MLPPSLLLALALLAGGGAAAETLAAVAPDGAQAASTQSAPPRSPIEVVEGLHAALVETMKLGKEAGFKARVAYVDPYIEQAFDVDYMSAKAVGGHWRQLSDAEKTRWREQFKAFLVANYAGNFNEHDGEHFETLGEEASARGTQIVLTKLVVPGDEDVTFNYRLNERQDRWRIIDIYLKGTVSELALRRSDFSSILKRDGFEALTTEVDKKIAKLRKGK